MTVDLHMCDAPAAHRIDLPGRSLRSTPAREFPCVTTSLPSPCDVDVVEFLRLHRAIAEATAGRPNPIIQIVDTGGRQGNVEIAYNLSWIASRFLNKRTLFIEASGRPGAVPGLTLPQGTLADVLLGRTTTGQAIAVEPTLDLFVAALHRDDTSDVVLAARGVQALFDDLRPSFDMIVLAPPPTLEVPVAAILKTMVDGSVLVIEAGFSRARHVQRCAALLAGGDSPLIGGIIWRPRPVLRRRLFRRQG